MDHSLPGGSAESWTFLHAAIQCYDEAELDSQACVCVGAATSCNHILKVLKVLQDRLPLLFGVATHFWVQGTCGKEGLRRKRINLQFKIKYIEGRPKTGNQSDDAGQTGAHWNEVFQHLTLLHRQSHAMAATASGV